MLALIIQKEILDNLLNARFVAACIISIVIVISSVVVLTNSHRTEVQDYQNRLITQDDFIDRFGHLNRAGWMARPLRGPSHYQPVVSGIDRETQEKKFASNPLPTLFSRLDLVTVVTIIMSLVAILFSYNALSGEKEAGILKQMLSTATPRSIIVLGKFIGGSLSLIVPFTVGVLAGLVYIALRTDAQFQNVDLFVFLLLLFTSYLYISAFYALGLLFSARSQTSNVAVLKSLFAWVILVLTLPNISPFFAAEIYRIPSKAKIDQSVWELQGEERDKILNLRTQEMLKTTYADIAGVVVDMSTMFGERKNEIQTKAEKDTHFKQRYDEYRKAWVAMVEAVNAEQRAKANKVKQEFDKRSEYQEKLAAMFASISPLSNYVFAATDLTDTGIHREDNWQTQVDAWYAALDPYLKAKTQKEMEKRPATTFNDYLDLRDRPRFQYQPPTISERIDLVLPRLGILAFFNALFFTGALVSFLKYDVR